MINREYDEKINSLIEMNRDEIISEWMELVRIPSVEGEAEENAPFGRECRHALDKALELYNSHGLSCRIADSFQYGVSEFGNGEKTIGLFVHTDVVPTGDGWVYTSPFEPVIVNGHLIGRGVSDNKSGVIASLCAMTFIKECGIPLKSKLMTFIGSNEETRMLDVRSFAETEKMPDLSIVPDSGFPCRTGEKGIVHAWAECRQPLNDILAFEGGSAFNIVLDEVRVTVRYSGALEDCLRKIASERKDFSYEKSDSGTVLLTAFGMAKHAAYPEESKNAAAVAADILSGCYALSDADRAVMKDLHSFFSAYYGKGLGVDHLDKNFGRLTAINGMVKTENGKLCASIDIRYGTALDPCELEKRLCGHLEKMGWTVTSLENRPGFMTDANSRVPGITEEVYSEITGDTKKSCCLPHATYARYLKNAFSVGVRAPLGNSGVIDMPEGHGGDHQRDECIAIDDFFRAVRILIHIIIQCDKYLNE